MFTRRLPTLGFVALTFVVPPFGAEQAQTSAGMSGATVLVFVAGWAIMGSIVGAIATAKGYRFWPWFAWGFFFGAISLIVILVKRREIPTPPMRPGPLVPPRTIPERPDIGR